MRTLVAILVLSLIACSRVSAEDYDMADYEVMDTNTLVPTETTPSVPSTSATMPIVPTSAPSPTSTSVAPTIPPAPSNPEAVRYTLTDFSTNKICLNMTAVLKVVVKRNDNSEALNVTLARNSLNGTVAEGSTCMITNQTATVLIIDPSQPDLFTLMLRFNGTDQYWSMAEMGVVYGEVAFATKTGLDKNSQQISNTRSFKCDAVQQLVLSNVTGNPTQLSANLTISSLQVQVFQFKDDNTGEFGSATSCTLDSKQNKIVPIAVGAALAGLVVVVLIAYLIGRLRSRKQSSYEALS